MNQVVNEVKREKEGFIIQLTKIFNQTMQKK